MQLAEATLDNLGVLRGVASPVPADPAAALELMCRDDLRASLGVMAQDPTWGVQCVVLISRFAQYRHLDELDRLVRGQPELRAR